MHEPSINVIGEMKFACRAMRTKCDREAIKAELAGKPELAKKKRERADRLTDGLAWLDMVTQ
jgi:hypothetical protein